MEQRHTVNFCCVIQCEWYSGVLCRHERMRLFPCSWSDFYARVFFPNMVCEWNPACIRIHQHASGCRLQTHQHAGTSHFSCCGAAIGASGVLQAGVWHALKGDPLWTAKEAGCLPQCAVVSGQRVQVQARSLGWKAVWFPLHRTGRDQHCNWSWSRMGRAWVSEAADFAIIFMQKDQNKQTQNDN